MSFWFNPSPSTARLSNLFPIVKNTQLFFANKKYIYYPAHNEPFVFFEMNFSFVTFFLDNQDVSGSSTGS